MGQVLAAIAGGGFSGKEKGIDLENYLSTSIAVRVFFFLLTQLHYNFFYEACDKEAIYILKSLESMHMFTFINCMDLKTSV